MTPSKKSIRYMAVPISKEERSGGRKEENNMPVLDYTALYCAVWCASTSSIDTDGGHPQDGSFVFHGRNVSFKNECKIHMAHPSSSPRISNGNWRPKEVTPSGVCCSLINDDTDRRTERTQQREKVDDTLLYSITLLHCAF